MKFITYLFALTISFIVLEGCKKPESQNETNWNDTKIVPYTGIPKLGSRGIVYLDNDNNIVTADYTGTFQKTIYRPALGTATITALSISPKLDKIAFKTATGNITIIDSSGAVLQSSIPNSSNLNYFAWYYDNNLLYGVNTVSSTAFNVVKIYGSSNLPAGLPTPIVPGTLGRKMLFCYITPENDIFYSCVYGSAYAKLGYMTNGTTIDSEYDNNTSKAFNRFVAINNPSYPASSSSHEGITFASTTTSAKVTLIANHRFTFIVQTIPPVINVYKPSIGIDGGIEINRGKITFMDYAEAQNYPVAPAFVNASAANFRVFDMK